MDLPKEQENSYLSNQFVKLDKDFAKIDIASKTAGLMTQTITKIETYKAMDLTKTKKKRPAKAADLE